MAGRPQGKGVSSLPKESTTPGHRFWGKQGGCLRAVAQGPGIPAPPFLPLLQEGEASRGEAGRGSSWSALSLPLSLSQPCKPKTPFPGGGASCSRSAQAGPEPAMGSGVQPPETAGMERPFVGSHWPSAGRQLGSELRGQWLTVEEGGCDRDGKWELGERGPAVNNSPATGRS